MICPFTVMNRLHLYSSTTTGKTLNMRSCATASPSPHVLGLPFGQPKLSAARCLLIRCHWPTTRAGVPGFWGRGYLAAPNFQSQALCLADLPGTAWSHLGYLMSTQGPLCMPCAFVLAAAGRSALQFISQQTDCNLSRISTPVDNVGSRDGG